MKTSSPAPRTTPARAPARASQLHLRADLERVHAHTVRRIDDARVDAELRRYLVAYRDTVQAAKDRRRVSPVSDPAAFFLLILRAEGQAIDASVVDAAAGLDLYGLALTLFDAIQDDELHPPVDALSPAVCSNAALVLFVLACDAIAGLGARARVDAGRLQAAFLQHSLAAGTAQHRDLQRWRPPTLAAAVNQARGKTSIHALVGELAALAAGCDPARVDLYRRVGDRCAILRQCANDLRDIFGHARSRDLEAGKPTLPVVAFFDEAGDRDERARMRQLLASLPGSTEEVRRLLVQSGAVRRVALVMERARQDIHAAIDALAPVGDGLELYREFVDAFTGQLYRRARPAAA